MLLNSIKTELRILFSEWFIYILLFLLVITYYLFNLMFGLSSTSNYSFVKAMNNASEFEISTSFSYYFDMNTNMVYVLQSFVGQRIHLIFIILGIYIAYNDLNKKIFKERIISVGVKTYYLSKTIVLYFLCLLYTLIMSLVIFMNHLIDINYITYFGMSSILDQIPKTKTISFIVIIFLLSMINFMRAFLGMFLVLIIKKAYAIGIIMIFTMSKLIMVYAYMDKMYIDFRMKINQLDSLYETFFLNIYYYLLKKNVSFKVYESINPKYDLNHSIVFFILQITIMIGILMLVGHIEEKRVGERL